VSLDLNVYRWMWKDPILPLLEGVIAKAEIVKASEDDLRVLGLDAESLHSRRPHKTTVVTRGPRGAIAFAGEDRLEIGSRARKVVDPTGGGDAFMAGLLSVLFFGGDLRRALDRGAELAARAVAKVGATSWLR
jgi:sugar/nucleoside kinase (ribokinase family)